MKTVTGTLLVLFALAAVLPALVALAGQGPTGDELVIGAAAVPQAAQDHDLAVATFEKLFTGSVISGDTVAFSFEIVNQGLQQDTARWQLVSNNATAETADEITIASGDALLASGFSLRTGPGGISWNTSGARTGDHTVTLSVDPVSGESDTANNSRSVTVRLIERPLHDVAVTTTTVTSGDGVTPIGTSDIPSGTLLGVNVTTLNRGSVLDTFLLELTDDTDNRLIDSLHVTIGPGEQVTLGLFWNTSGASSGDHTLTATAILSGDADTTNNAFSTAVPLRIAQAEIFISGADAIFPPDPTGSPLVLMNPGISTEVQPLTARFLENHDAVFQSGLADPAIGTLPQPLSGTIIVNEDATFGEGMVLQDPNLTTQVQPLTSNFIENHDAHFQSGLLNIIIPVEAQGLTSTFVRNQDAVFGPGIQLRDPFAGAGAAGVATIRSASVHLQGRPDSTGAFLRVNGQDNFVDSNGSFSFTVAPGTHRIQIRAPGYLTVDVVSPSGFDTTLNAGDLLIIPELTMVYGDANGDGVIDVRDLAAGASNFGQIETAPQ